FYELMFRRGAPFFYAFDLLWLDGEDLRALPLSDRKKRLRKLTLPRNGSRLLYLDHFEGNGSRFFVKAWEIAKNETTAVQHIWQRIIDGRDQLRWRAKWGNYLAVWAVTKVLTPPCDRHKYDRA